MLPQIDGINSIILLVHSVIRMQYPRQMKIWRKLKANYYKYKHCSHSVRSNYTPIHQGLSHFGNEKTSASVSLCGSEASLLACGRQAAHSHEYYNEFPHVRVLTRMPKQFLWIKSSIPEVCLPSRIMVMFAEFSFGVCFAILRRFICLCPPSRSPAARLRFRQCSVPTAFCSDSVSFTCCLVHWMAEWVNEDCIGEGVDWGSGDASNESPELADAMPLLCHSSEFRVCWWVHLFI